VKLESKKRISLLWALTAPVVGVSTIVTPYLYWRGACLLWGIGDNASSAAIAASITHFLFMGVVMAARFGP
jgi:hypothetical protein